jgi:hypothetical protein
VGWMDPQGIVCLLLFFLLVSVVHICKPSRGARAVFRRKNRGWIDAEGAASVDKQRRAFLGGVTGVLFVCEVEFFICVVLIVFFVLSSGDDGI